LQVLQPSPTIVQLSSWSGESHPGLQVTLTQSPLVQVTSHEHARPQLKLRHD